MSNKIDDQALLVHLLGTNGEASIVESSYNNQALPRKRLVRDDVARMITENGGPEGLDLSAYDLSGINLSKLDLHGVIFGNLDILEVSDIDIITKSANLEGAWLERSNLRQANFGRVNLKGAHFYYADLTEASLWAVNAEGADFRKANLTHANLYSAVLKDCRLKDASLLGTNLYLAELSGATLSANSIGPTLLQEDFGDYNKYYQRWYTKKVIRERFAKKHLAFRYKEAQEIYLMLKNTFLNNGRYDDASWSYFKERQMERKTFYPSTAICIYEDVSNKRNLTILRLKYTVKWLLYWINELIIGYGERPLRVVVLAVIIILLFPFLYWSSNGIISTTETSVRWIDYFHYSLATFSTVGFPDLIPVNDFAKLLTSLEALSGISLLALLMFALGRRIGGS